MYKRQTTDRDKQLILDEFRRGSQDTPGGFENRGFSGNRPVSYTHLRAHETVLDLVCRLLLEKKNKEKPTKVYDTHIKYRR